MTQVRVGISGWTYEGWRGRFYPAGLPRSRELQFASRQLNSIEINGTFYALQRPESFRSWYAQVPGDFIFSVKGNRYITHVRRLNDVSRPVANFFASGILALREKLGPILWQFPPNFPFHPEKLESFLEGLPRDTGEAARLARGHDSWLRGRSLPETDRVRKLRYAIEIRNPTFASDAFVRILRRCDVALVFADSAGRYPFFEDLTSDFIYLRMHGNAELYVSGYGDTDLRRLARRIRLWTSGKSPKDAVLHAAPPPGRTASRDAFVYFDNDVKARAPFDASRLLGMLTAFVPRTPMPRLPPDSEAA